VLSQLMSRRTVLKLGGAAGAVTLLAACQSKVVEKIVKETVIVTEEKIVKETVIVTEERIVEKVITVAPPTPTQAPAQKVTVTFTYGTAELSESEMKQFQSQNPNITLANQSMDDVKFFAMLAAGNPPDILCLQGHGFPHLLARGIPLNLSPYVEVSKLIKIDDLAPSCNYYKAMSPMDIGKGDLYGMPKDWSPDLSYFINTVLFERAQVPIPDDTKPVTYDQMADMAKKLTKKEGDRTLSWGWCWANGWEDRYWLIWLAQNDKSLFSSDFQKFLLADSPDAKQMVKFLLDIAKAGYAQSPLSPSPRGWPGPDFVAGQIAMQQYGFWFSGMVAGDIGSEGMVGEFREKGMMMPAPIWGDKGKRFSPTITSTGAICVRKTTHPDETYKAWEWYHAGEPAVTRSKAGWGVPALKSLYKNIPGEEVSPMRGQIKKVLMDELKYAEFVIKFNPFLRGMGGGGETSAVASVFLGYWERYLRGQMSFDEIIGNIQKDVDAMIKEGISKIV
jgi:multiple sugar transport system substrate-binding protein